MIVGLSFGSTSGIITTLGLMVGLYSGTGSKLAVIGGIITIAVSDAFSDALGIHMSEESEGQHAPKQIWMATLATFFCKFIISISFLIPVLLFTLSMAVAINGIWGLLLLTGISFFSAHRQGKSPWKVILEHDLIALAVIAATHTLGIWIRATFGRL